MTIKETAPKRLIDYSNRTGVENIINEAAEILNDGGIVVVPWGRPQRRIFAMLGVADDTEVAKKINRAKGRPENQTLSISIIPEAVTAVIIPESSPVLMRAAKRFRRNPGEILGDILRAMPIGFFLEARPYLGDWVTSLEEGRRVVYIGGGDTDHPQNFYSILYERFFRRYGRLLIGTSANRTGEDTHPVHEHKQAFEELGPAINLFVVDKDVRVSPIPIFQHHVSPTMINLLKDPAELIRRGSKHERVLEWYFGKVLTPKGAKIYTNSEREWETVLSNRLNTVLSRVGKTTPTLV